MTSDESKVMHSSQTHRGLGIEYSLFPFPEPGLLTRVGLHVLAVVALPDSVALLLHHPPLSLSPCLRGWLGYQNMAGVRKQGNRRSWRCV